ncbi:MAG: division/cell wall cluster transcriptional repressor MraZ [Candidatus Palauibacterales bacterium]|nr:division/cell wall cluster transcriptional repressor MraZ [Candidatus Palauibacterales bacterium]
MSSFLGSYRHQLDGKGRLSLPADFRRGSDADVFVLVQVQDDALTLFPEDAWGPVQEELRELQQRNPEARHYVLSITASARRVVPDSQGRILIPEQLRDAAGLDGEALVVGALNKIEIWDPERFQQRTGDRGEEVAELAQRIFA